MTASGAEIAAMHRAVVLSAFGLGTTSPNPPVGCVILDRHHRPVGEGHHVRKGEAHAEVHALRAAGEHARGGTAVVTLEPCNHHGRTPPCRQALLDAGIARVLIAVIDPTSREEGGAARLAAAGADVEIGLLADSARTVLRPWLHSLDTGRPHVTWLYELDAEGRARTASEALRTLHRTNADVVLDNAGHLTEGVPDGHGKDAFTLPTTTAAEPAQLLAALHAGGARSLLLATDPWTADRYLHADLIDATTFYAPRSSRSATTTCDIAQVLDGFRIDRVERHDDRLRFDTTAALLRTDKSMP
ncbi:bifunctional diaminohydroxyphosphoribosylaminopyrimidine deaminase/5-amino-6-(5-phosphoribosylamino)uracil reductase RibD [Saccharothrix longispora]|uniref:bifunctional diaminohydroxyphosphoribosylaminopyrimidine deaminase/5-amino-6-(5-phosphoribosylamino)uracil reductase RibD n=1 Tax=Saccharothrix longispora TaxID=33920 RepID=UPI0028FD7A3D|nr:bifunctional diaminohydroxyphosphoribosylaminopyrimidine deaminase/5-amino-6-(5-phosphoribosylamino)uracil reductase RibD [Saccharothrix longispora]MDU0289562.1 bifunctional diaminohydroxyphosphoribosylaminopyrimidine deaminase/5-amino-6-(5-phosphoribosylamino)uracil reductase RibD [Saccharothrix longispora]